MSEAHPRTLAWLNEAPALVVAKLTTMKRLQTHYSNQLFSEAVERVDVFYLISTFLRCHMSALMDLQLSGGSKLD